MPKIDLNKIATNVMICNIRPEVKVFYNVDGTVKVRLDYDVPKKLIHEFQEYVLRMEHLVDEYGEGQ